MIVVSDSSPLITLSKIGHVDLLPLMYAKVLITPQVLSEVAVQGAGLSGAAETVTATWIQVEPAGTELTSATRSWPSLGVGETSSILLAKRIAAEVILMDDRRARALARREGLKPLGCIGVLQQAYLSGLLPDVRAALQLLVRSGAFVDKRIVQSVLKILKLPQLEV